MKNKLFILFAVFSFNTITAQNTNFCGSSDVNNKAREANPLVSILEQQLKEHTKEFIERQNRGQQRNNQIYTIPIVFHVLHNYGEENISDEQIYDAVRIINEDFRMTNADIVNVVPAFDTVKADCEIEFRMPTKDPRGNCTNGINRYQSVLSLNGSDDSKFAFWPRDIYLNVWVVGAIGTAGVAGYAYYPSATSGLDALRDGIIILHDYVGSIGTGRVGTSRALTHEIGHVFNLPHPWGDTNEPNVQCGDDGVFDTPNTEGHTSCNLNAARCTPGVIENVQNYMEYSYCSNMFTEGQKLVMHAALNSPTGERNKLWSNYSLNISGSTASTNENTCEPIADFNSKRKVACVGEPITITDFSWRGPVSNWEWTFENADITTSNAQNPTVTFNTTGWQKVKLKVDNSFGSNTKEIEKMILVSDGNVNFFSDGFENSNEFENNYVVENFDNNESKWQLRGDASFSGGQSLGLNAIDADRYDIDVFTTPEYDLSGTSELKFKYSLATRSANPADITDRLKIYYSINCGESWSVFYNKTGLSLVNAGAAAGSFIPTKESDWKEEVVTLPNPALANNSARFKFELQYNEFSNNFFIDNINVDEVYNSVENIAANSFSVNVFPNPTNSRFNIQFSNANVGDANVQIFDATGKLVYNEKVKVNNSSYNHTINTSFANGLYHVNILHDGGISNTKLQVIE